MFVDGEDLFVEVVLMVSVFCCFYLIDIGGILVDCCIFVIGGEFLILVLIVLCGVVYFVI